ncbi:DNA-binding protein [Janthinobacterium sp.]|uniref:DNA-binding protein n=1 Tax=Janthinobacterium sp. TaxID=1871054 RepID=UPI00293D976C|nr:DNA-binding protein [Janthinobacterium sp.]
MARTGILYSHLVKAAEKVVSEGKNPTVDSVREALGGTGSKSTIAPLLKRWKAEHQEQLVEADVGMPAELLLAVKGVYEKLQADVRQQLELAGAAQALALEAAARRVEQSETEYRELSRTSVALAADLSQTKDEFAQLRAEHQARAVALAALESDNVGLRERLADRGAEVGALNQQLTQARKQFEHFQEASAAQRTDERQAAEQRAARLERDLAAAQQSLLHQQACIAQQEMQLSQLRADASRWQTAADAAATELAAMRPERDQLVYQYKEVVTSSFALGGKLETAERVAGEARIAHATSNMQVALLRERLELAEVREEERERERRALILENALLQVKSSPQAGPADAGAPAKK